MSVRNVSEIGSAFNSLPVPKEDGEEAGLPTEVGDIF